MMKKLMLTPCVAFVIIVFSMNGRQYASGENVINVGEEAGTEISDEYVFNPVMDELEKEEEFETLKKTLERARIDSMVNIPSESLYDQWITYRVHPYNYNLTNKKDTTIIVLYDTIINNIKYVHPLASNHVTSGFGARWKRWHYGVDVGLKRGDTIRCAWDGKVRVSKYDRDYGNVIVVRHYNGLETLYAHLSKRFVQSGDVVKSGTFIGLGGSTGRSTGPHLHFEVNYLGEAIDPSDFISFKHRKLKKSIIALTANTFRYVGKARYYRSLRESTIKRERSTVKRKPPQHIVPPLPYATLGKKFRGGKISVNAFKAQQGLVPILENFRYQYSYSIISFTCSFTRAGRDPLMFYSNSPFITSEMRAAFTEATPGSKVVFTNIKVKGQKGETDYIDPIYFTLN